MGRKQRPPEWWPKGVKRAKANKRAARRNIRRARGGRAGACRPGGRSRPPGLLTKGETGAPGRFTKGVNENMNVHFMSQTDKWSTPVDFYERLNREFHFDFDPCPLNPQFDGLSIPWGKCNFMNPPYGRVIGKWIKKASENPVTVCLLPARTDTRWFHDYIYGRAEIRFIKGRLKFGGGKNSAPFPSMVVIFR